MIMDKQLEERIRQRAYELWMQNGCLPDRDEDYWYQAEQEILGDSDEQSAGDVGGGNASDVGSASFVEGGEQGSGDESSASVDINPSPLGMTSQTADEILPAGDEAQSAPTATKTRRKRAAAPAASEGGDEPAGAAPKRRRTARTP
jgi:hypothetical protein